MWARNTCSLAYTLLEVHIDAYFHPELLAIMKRMERLIGPIPPIYGIAATKLLHEETKWDDDEPVPEYQEDEPVTGQWNRQSDRNSETNKGLNEYENPIQKMLGLVPLPQNEIQALGDLLGKLFKYHPDERLSASEALGHEWFKTEDVAEGAESTDLHSDVESMIQRRPFDTSSGSEHHVTSAYEAIVPVDLYKGVCFWQSHSIWSGLACFLLVILLVWVYLDILCTFGIICHPFKNKEATSPSPTCITHIGIISSGN